MSLPLLVTYATRYGSTAEVAESVAKVFGERGLSVELQPMRKVRSIEGYRAVVLGIPIYIGNLHQDARRFLKRYRDALSARATAVFALGPTRADDDWQAAREQFDKTMSRYPWLVPVAREMFGGRYDPAALRFPDSLLAMLPGSPLHGQPASDVRDWEAIRTWAMEVAGRLPPEG